MGLRFNKKRVIGIIATITGAAILITRLPSWIWMMALGGFLIWCGWMLFTESR